MLKCGISFLRHSSNSAELNGTVYRSIMVWYVYDATEDFFRVKLFIMCINMCLGYDNGALMLPCNANVHALLTRYIR